MLSQRASGATHGFWLTRVNIWQVVYQLMQFCLLVGVGTSYLYVWWHRHHPRFTSFWSEFLLGTMELNVTTYWAIPRNPCFISKLDGLLVNHASATTWSIQETGYKETNRVLNLVKTSHHFKLSESKVLLQDMHAVQVSKSFLTDFARLSKEHNSLYFLLNLWVDNNSEKKLVLFNYSVK